MNARVLSEPDNLVLNKRITGAWLVWGLAAAFYFSDYLARVAPGVMHRHLQVAFNINEAGFGILTASFYVPYILMQLPVGLMVDRSSIRWLLTIMSLVTALGCCIFGLSGSLGAAAVGRMFIGFSAAFAFVCALRLATTWFPPAMLGLLAGLTQALGMLGAAAGEAPVSFLVGTVGWRHSMLVIAFLFIILAGLMYRFVRDTPKDGAVKLGSCGSTLPILGSLKMVLSNRQAWYNAFYAGFLFGPTAVIGEALGPAFLQYGREMPAHAAAFATGLIFIGWAIGGPLAGWVSDRIGRRKPLMIASALFGIFFTLIFVYAPHMSPLTAYVLFFLFGMTNIGVAISYAVATELHHPKVIGTSIAFTNMTSILVGAMMQPLVGYLVDTVAGVRGYDVAQLLFTDFQYGFQILPICSLVALILACKVKETYCRPVDYKKIN